MVWRGMYEVDKDWMEICLMAWVSVYELKRFFFFLFWVRNRLSVEAVRGFFHSGLPLWEELGSKCGRVAIYADCPLDGSWGGAWVVVCAGIELCW